MRTSCRLKWSSFWWILPSFTCWRGWRPLAALVRRCCLAFCSWTWRTRSLIFVRSRPGVKNKNKNHRKEGTTITHSHVLRNCSGCFVRITRLNHDPKIQAALKNLLCGSIGRLIYKNNRTNLLIFHRGLYVDVTDVMADKNTYNSTYNICDLFQDQSRSNINFSRDSLSPPGISFVLSSSSSLTTASKNKLFLPWWAQNEILLDHLVIYG